MNALRLASTNISAVVRPQGVRYFQSSRAALGPILHATDSDFTTLIKRDGRIIVQFHAEWCGPCKFMDPILAAKAENSDITLIKVDIDACPTVANQHQIRGVPTLKAYKGGAELKESVGALRPPQLDAFIDEAFGKK
ncbi:hypothetical protein DFQ27_007571 [Actinomortierella ambigua]|uniref:Thioredoxin domain-containing protein n=1 Tax=Actinomortierella ambigua TaxID=1343610 RepID=A0A9P6QJ94_9FUNG|nr:hypothetical protein DFQ27_007571 [Actinomortierella ambigua]